MGRDKLIPDIKVSPVDGVEYQEQDRGKDEEKPSVGSHGYHYAAWRI